MSFLFAGMLFFFMLSAFFSTSEFVVISVNQMKLEHRFREGDAKAGRILELIRDADRIISCILVGNNIANVSLSALMTLYISELAAQYPSVGNHVPLLTALIITPLVLLIGEIVPKNLGGRYADFLILVIYPLLRFCLFFFKPVLDFLTAILGFLNRYTGGTDDTLAHTISREEFVHWVRRSVMVGMVHEEAEKMIQTTFEFRETTVREIMVPLLDVRAVPVNMSVQDFLLFARKHLFTRYPVYEDRVDRMIGHISVNEVLRGKTREGDGIARYVHPVVYVPSTLPIDKLLFQMQSKGEKMVVAVDEYGGCDGIATVEDVIEELVGEIAEDHEVFEPMIKKIGENEYLVDASMDIEDLNDELELNLKKDGYDTLAGFLLKQFERIPTTGESFFIEDHCFEIVEMEHLAITLVKISLFGSQAAEVTEQKVSLN